MPKDPAVLAQKEAVAQSTSQKLAALANLPTGIIITMTTLDGKSLGTFVASGKEFSSGSLGYYAGGKLTLANSVFAEGTAKAGEVVELQVGCNMTIVGTKPVAA